MLLMHTFCMNVAFCIDLLTPYVHLAGSSQPQMFTLDIFAKAIKPWLTINVSSFDPTSGHSIVFPPNLSCLNDLPTGDCPLPIPVGIFQLYQLVSPVWCLQFPQYWFIHTCINSHISEPDLSQANDCRPAGNNTGCQWQWVTFNWNIK